MPKKEKSLEQWQIDKMLARAYYSRAFWTLLAPALIFISLMCGDIGRSGGDAISWFMQHWIINSSWLMCIIGLLCYAIVEISKGLRRASKFITTPIYATRKVGVPASDGTWVAELSKDGKPYAQVEVGSISTLAKKTRR